MLTLELKKWILLVFLPKGSRSAVSFPLPVFLEESKPKVEIGEFCSQPELAQTLKKRNILHFTGIRIFPTDFIPSLPSLLGFHISLIFQICFRGWTHPNWPSWTFQEYSQPWIPDPCPRSTNGDTKAQMGSASFSCRIKSHINPRIISLQQIPPWEPLNPIFPCRDWDWVALPASSRQVILILPSCSSSH